MCAAADPARRAGLRRIPNIDFERFMPLDNDQLGTVLECFLDCLIFISRHIYRAIRYPDCIDCGLLESLLIINNQNVGKWLSANALFRHDDLQ